MKFNRTYVHRESGKITLGWIDVKKGLVRLQNGEVAKPEEVFERYSIEDNSKYKSNFKEVETFRYDPICGEKRYYIRKLRVKCT